MSRYIALFKPYGVLSSFTHEEKAGPTSDGFGAIAAQRKSSQTSDVSDQKRTLSEFGLPKGVYAAGRLDYDSEGLLILSDDGDFIHRLTDPQYKLPKTYIVQVEGAPTEDALKRLRAGLMIKDYRTQPCQARVLDLEPGFPPRSKPITPHGPTAWLEIILSEGKKRQVRHMTAAVGLPTLRLMRVAIGPIALTGLQAGQWRDLSERELDSIISHHSTRQSKSSPRTPTRRKKDLKPNKSRR